MIKLCLSKISEKISIINDFLKLISESLICVITCLAQDYLNNNNTENKQEELSRIQLLKINCTTEDYRQDNESNNDNLTLQHDRKA